MSAGKDLKMTMDIAVTMEKIQQFQKTNADFIQTLATGQMETINELIDSSMKHFESLRSAKSVQEVFALENQYFTESAKKITEQGRRMFELYINNQPRLFESLSAIPEAAAKAAAKPVAAAVAAAKPAAKAAVAAVTAKPEAAKPAAAKPAAKPVAVKPTAKPAAAKPAAKPAAVKPAAKPAAAKKPSTPKADKIGIVLPKDATPAPAKAEPAPAKAEPAVAKAVPATDDKK